MYQSAFDQEGLAARAISVLALAIMDVADVDVLEARCAGDVLGLPQGLGRRGGLVPHAEVGMKGREVQRHIRRRSWSRIQSHIRRISSSESFSPGMTRFVISNQTFVSLRQPLERVEHGLEGASR